MKDKITQKISIYSCGDLGNVVQTLAKLPDEWNHRLQITINDGDAEIIARSIILLLIAVFVDDIDQAIECMIHVWYSAFIRLSDSELLHTQIKPMLERVRNTIKDKDPESLRAKTWTRGNRSIKVVLKQRTWMTLPRMLDRANQINPIDAFASRRATVLCRHRWDHRDGFMMKLPPKQRTAHVRYLLHGLLLPFGHNRVEFVVPNPFLYRMPAQWQGNDAVNPVFAWPLHDVLEAPGAASENDVYGKLFNYLYDHLRAFIDRINKSPTFFYLLQVNPFELDKCLPHGSYDRIDATAITDKHRGFPIHALETLMPILKNKKQNPHATMVQFFETAVESLLRKSEELSKLDQYSAELKLVKEIIAVAPSSSSISSWSPEVLIYPPLIDLYASHWEVFEQYLANEKFTERVRPGTVMKQDNTIVPKFRYQLKIQKPLDAEYRKTVWRRFREPVDGKSVYLEWQKEDEEEKVKAEE
ncbi:Uncharacterized protein PECH_002412 [Penicillium ucsense]|uniref:DUF4470 domain-containing protein n=1 Tax=Penicillium ucsense TaxID=2839758 RepID=A0A8J8W7B4_9EURO|nr:Uncharacterized protein PECM_003041 [Penicillium ucsense]KAF7737948.1 Uncharacterized protein PECH_002412 [Penicillium ucsense]